MRKVKVYTVISVYRQRYLAAAKLKEEWLAANPEHTTNTFKQPGKEAIDAEVIHFPLRTFAYTGFFHAWGMFGSHEDFGTSAIIEKEDGGIEELTAEHIQFMEKPDAKV